MKICFRGIRITSFLIDEYCRIELINRLEVYFDARVIYYHIKITLNGSECSPHKGMRTNAGSRRGGILKSGYRICTGMGLPRIHGTGFEAQRQTLVNDLTKRGYVQTEAVRSAILGIPREKFLPEHARGSAYHDRPLSIGLGQTISAPHMVAIMSEALELEGGEKVLEIGTGSGYHAAVTAELVGEKGHVFSVERHDRLAAGARESLEQCGLADRVSISVGDGSTGLPGEAPFHRIYVTCAAPCTPPPLLEQLADGGILLVPEGRGHFQELVRTRKAGGGIERENLGGVAFVPLVGEHGF